MLNAVVIKAPAVGAQLTRFNGDKARAAPGVKAVVLISDGLAVVADTYWHARKASELVEVDWGEGALVGRSSDDLSATLEQAAKLDGLVARREGEVGTFKLGRTTSAGYHLPYLAHACMEPMNCTAWVKPHEVEIWTGSQAQTAVQQSAAVAAGVEPEQVKVHTLFLGGGFGRRAAQDFVIAAVETSRAVGAPVKVIYSREDDMRGAYYRPISYTEISGGVDATGNAVMLQAKVVVPSLAEATGFKRLVRPDGVDRVAVEGLADMPYDIPNIKIEWVKHDFGVPIWFWRSVGASHNTFVTETFIDELATLAKKDPYQFRRELLDKQPRLRSVLESGRRQGGLGQASAKGNGSRDRVRGGVRQLDRAGGGSFSRGRQAARASRDMRHGLRPRGKPGAGQSADGELHYLCAVGRALRSHYLQSRQSGAEQLRRLSSGADERSAANRSALGCRARRSRAA